MTNDFDQISGSFAAHEHLAPDAETVLARAKEISRSYQRRRWAVRATGGAVLAGGLVAGGIALPGQAGHSSPGAQAIAPAAASTASASPTASSTYTQAQELAKYFSAGYGLDNAHALSTLWNISDLTQVKAQAGEKLLEGQTLPVKPENSAYPIGGGAESAQQKAVDAFFSAGYDYNDAVTLAGMWNKKNTYNVKAEAGQDLLDGKTLPIPPSGPPTAAGTTQVVTGSAAARLTKEGLLKKALIVRGRALHLATAAASGSADVETPADQAYFDAGYDYSDAVSLAKIWNETDINSVKSEAGQKLLDGDTLPVPPSGTPVAPENKDVETFFNAGYDYNDAVKLGKLWNISDTYQVKIAAGKKLADGQTLPIAP